MEAKLPAILITTALLLAPAVLAGTATNPNVTDGTGEPDPRTGGATPLPPSLDITKAWIQSTPDTVSFTIEVSSLTIPHSTTPSAHYEVVVDVPSTVFNGFEPCADATKLAVYTAPLAGPFLEHLPPRPGIECITPDGQSHNINMGVTEASGAVDMDSGELTMTIERVLDGAYATHPDGSGARLVLDAGTTLSNPTVTVYDDQYTYDTAGPGQDQTV